MNQEEYIKEMTMWGFDYGFVAGVAMTILLLLIMGVIILTI